MHARGLDAGTDNTHNMTCDLAAQIRSRISLSSRRIISKRSLKSSLSRQIFEL